MIGNDQELGRIGERDVVGEDLRLHMTVHADQRQPLRLAIDLLGDAPCSAGTAEPGQVRVGDEVHRQLLVEITAECGTVSVVATARRMFRRRDGQRDRSTPRSRSAIFTGRPVRSDSLPAMPTATDADPVQPVRRALQPVVPGTAKRRRAAARRRRRGRRALLDLDVLGRFPVPLQGQPLAAGPDDDSGWALGSTSTCRPRR